MWGLAIAAAVVWPMLTTSSHWLDVGVVVSTYVLLALGMHVIFGLVGLPFVGYAGLFGVGAYVAALLNTRWKWDVDWTLVVSPLAVCALAFLLAVMFSRLRDVYFMIVTLAVGQLIPIVAAAWSVTGGPNGLYGIEPLHIAGHQLVEPRSSYYLALAFILASAGGLFLFGRSRTGTAWLAVGRDDTASEALGVPVGRVKIYAMTVGGLWAGLAGALYASQLSAISPDTFTVYDSILLASAVLIGGRGSLGGTMLGAFALYALPEIFRELQSYRLLVFGIAIMVVIKLRPDGVIPRRPRVFPVRHLSLPSDGGPP